MANSKRNTVQQQLIFDGVMELNTHPTAEQVYNHVSKKHPSISKATVYRNLSRMAESGKLHNIGSFDGAAHYDYNCDDHYHFICDECKSVFDIDGDFADIIEKARITEGIVRSCNIEFFGLCRKCDPRKSM